MKLKNFFPSEEASVGQSFPETSARVTTGGGFRPSQMLDFTPSDVMPQSGYTRYPPSYLEPNYKHELPSSLGQQVALDKQFSFPQDSHSMFQSTPLPTTPVVSYLDPYTQQNYRYTPTPPSIIQYQREQPAQDDQAYTVQSSLLVGSHQQQNHQQPYPGHVEDVYLKRPGYVFDESPAPSYRRPTRPPPSLPPPPTTAAHKISYDSHDYPPPSYAAEQTSISCPSSQSSDRCTNAKTSSQIEVEQGDQEEQVEHHHQARLIMQTTSIIIRSGQTHSRHKYRTPTRYTKEKSYILYRDMDNKILIRYLFPTKNQYILD